jgi:hypothetical protein
VIMMESPDAVQWRRVGNMSQMTLSLKVSSVEYCYSSLKRRNVSREAEDL